MTTLFFDMRLTLSESPVIVTASPDGVAVGVGVGVGVGATFEDPRAAASKRTRHALDSLT